MRRFLPQLIDPIWNGETDQGEVFDVTLPLDQAAEGYKAMDERRGLMASRRRLAALRRRPAVHGRRGRVDRGRRRRRAVSYRGRLRERRLPRRARHLSRRERRLEAVDHVRALAGRYNVREVVFNPWRFGQAAQELEREGLTVVAFPQTDSRMIPASARLQAAIVEQRLAFADDREPARHDPGAIAQHSCRGWRIGKPRKKTNIDAIVALCMAVQRAEFKPEPVELVGWL